MSILSIYIYYFDTSSEDILALGGLLCKGLIISLSVIIEVVISVSGAIIGGFVMKKIKEKIYDNNGCNSGCIAQCEIFVNKTSKLVRKLSNTS